MTRLGPPQHSLAGSPIHLARSVARSLGPPGASTSFQWGTVSAVHTTAATVDVRLDGASAVTPGLRFASTYNPKVGDIVYVLRGTSGRTDRIVQGTLAAADEWASYTPTWTAGGGSPSVGNGSLSAAYLIVGQTMWWSLSFAFGSTTNGGTGAWTFGLPSGAAVASVLSEQDGIAKIYSPSSSNGGSQTFNLLGFVYFAAGATATSGIFFPQNSSVGGAMAAFNQSGGTPCPSFGGNTAALGNGGNLQLSATLFIA